MTALTEQAQNLLDRYLNELRCVLAGCRLVDAGEVERDVLDHINRSCADIAAPVDQSLLGAVLDKLGRPGSWLPSEEVPWYRRWYCSASASARSYASDFRRVAAEGPHEFRMAYASLAALAVGGLFLFDDDYWAFSGTFILLAFVLARAAVSLRSPDCLTSAQKWLLYPALCGVYVPVAGCLLVAGPVGGILFGIGLLELINYPQPLDLQLGFLSVYPDWVWLLCAVLLLSLAWYAVLGLVLYRRPQLKQQIFYPMAGPASPRRALVVGLVAATGCVLAAVGASYFVWNAWEFPAVAQG